MATLRHWSDWASGATYTFVATKSQYLAYHLLGAALSFLVDPLLANRILMTAAGIAAPYAMRALLRAFGTDERLAILSCILFWSRPLSIGFLPYVASLPVLFWALALVVRERREHDRRRAFGIAALATLLFYLHLSGYAVFLVVLGALALVPAPRPRGRLAFEWFVALAPSLVCAAIWAIAADPRGGPMLLAGDAVSFGRRANLGLLFAVWTHDVWPGPIDEIAGATFWILVLALGLQRTAEPEGARGLVARLAPFACVLVMFVAMPYRVGFGAMLNVRLAALLGYFALLIPRPAAGKRTDVPIAVGAGLALVVAANAIVKIRQAQRELGDFDAVLAAVPPGTRMLALHFDRSSYATHGAAFVHAGAYHRLRRGGVASVSFSEMAHWPVQFRPDARPPAKSNAFWDFEPCLFRNSIDGAYYDVVVSRGETDPFANDPPGPAWRRVAVIDRWRVDVKVAGTWRHEGAPDPGPCP